MKTKFYLITLIILILGFGLLTFSENEFIKLKPEFLKGVVSAVGEDWVIENDLVYFEDTNVYLSAFPHTITSPTWVYFNLTSKVFTGDIDLVFGFNGTNAKPTKAELYKPHWVNWTTEHSQFFQDVSGMSLSSEPCDYGNEYNTYKRSANYQICGEYNETTFECLYYNTTSSVVCFDSYEPTPFTPNLNYTIYWQTKHSRLENWVDITSKFNKLSHSFQGMDTWHYLKNVSIEANQSYQIKAYVDVPIGLTDLDGKYFWAIKRTQDTLSEAIANNYFYALDPWYNSSWTYKKNITIDHTKVNGTQTNFPVLINWTDTDLRDDALANGDDIVFTNSTGGKLDHEIEFYNSTTGWLVAWVRVPSLSGDTNTIIQMYYGNAGASNQENVEGVWDGTGAVGVWHFNEGSGLTAYDSTSNSYDITLDNETMWTADGVRGDDANNYDGVSAKTRAIGSEDKTIIVKFKTSDNTNYGTLLGWENGVQGILLQTHGGSPRVWKQSGTDTSATTINNNQWHIMALTDDGVATENILLYIDGGFDDTLTHANFDNAAEDNCNVRLFGTHDDYIVDADIEFGAIYNRILSAGEIKTQYNNQYSPSSFYGVGAEETESAGDTEYPVFSNYWDNNATLIDSGTGLFNVTITSTNGTVLLEVDGNNITATNLTANVYNVSYDFTSSGVYSYKWHSWGNGSSANYNVSNIQSYTVNSSDTCSCPSINTNWEINLADYCNITSNCDIGTGNITFINTGTFFCNATITTNKFSPKDSVGVTEKYDLGADCKVKIG